MFYSVSECLQCVHPVNAFCIWLCLLLHGIYSSCIVFNVVQYKTCSSEDIFRMHCTCGCSYVYHKATTLIMEMLMMRILLHVHNCNKSTVFKMHTQMHQCCECTMFQVYIGYKWPSVTKHSVYKCSEFANVINPHC